MAVLLLLHIFFTIYSAYGVHLMENANGIQIKCSLEDAELIISHPYDCSKYFLCKDGVAHLEVCPMGLHFNDVLHECDYPDKVECDREKFLEQLLLIQNGEVECPIKDGSNAIHLPHPSDCGRFYTCHAGTPHLKSCLPGLHFNARLQVCDYPERAGCDKSQSSTSRDKIIQEELMGCLTDKYAKHFIPSPHNCSEFIVCENGHTLTGRCSSGLHFNVYTKSCDHPDKADCLKINKLSFMQGGPGVPSSHCPTADGKETVFFNHPSNCSEYYMCGHGFAYKFACPARLHFNLRRKVCDYEWLAGCQTSNKTE